MVNGFVLGKNHGPHLDYNEHILNKLKKWEDNHPGYTPEEAKTFVEDFAKTAKDAIKRNGGITTDF